MAFRQCFFSKCTWSDQNSSTKSSTKFYILNCPGNWTKKFSPFFPRNIHYRARQKGPLFQFFSALCDFFFEFFSKEGFHLQFFFSFATEWILKNTKVSSLSVFRHYEIFSKKCSHKRVPHSSILLKSSFWALDMAPTLACQGLFPLMSQYMERSLSV